jgi:hypothetical protein
MRPLSFWESSETGSAVITAAVADWKAADLNLDY